MPSGLLLQRLVVLRAVAGCGGLQLIHLLQQASRPPLLLHQLLLQVAVLLLQPHASFLRVLQRAAALGLLSDKFRAQGLGSLQTRRNLMLMWLVGQWPLVHGSCTAHQLLRRTAARRLPTHPQLPPHSRQISIRLADTGRPVRLRLLQSILQRHHLQGAGGV
jgi:hypothetical protein